MKKEMKYVVIAVAVLSTVVSFASLREQNSPKHVSIEQSKIINQNPNVIIRNKKGASIYEGVDSLSKPMQEFVSDMNLPNGAYTFEMVNDTQVEITPFVVENGTILVDTKSAKAIFKPTLRVKDDLVLVTQLSLDKEPLKVKMYYCASDNNSNYFNLIHSEKIGKEMIIKRAYNLDKSKTGTYRIELISEGKVFTETFTL